MKEKVVIVAVLGLLLVAVIIARTPRPASGPLTAASVVSPGIVADRGGAKENANLVAAYGKLPLSFEVNQGQTDRQVKFFSRGHGYTLFLTPTEGVLALRKSVPPEKQDRGNVAAGFSPAQSVKGAATPAPPALVLRMKLVGANPAPQVRGLEQLPGKSHYFIGNDPAGWRTNIPTFAKVKYTDIYRGVDLVYYGNQRQLEYDFVVGPGANPRTIRLAIAGAEKLEAVANGDLVLHTRGGEIRLHKPIVYQELGDVRKEIAGRYVLRGTRQIGFEVAAYDATKPLIVDPVLSYSTYLGGNGLDEATGIAVDLSGSAYITGITNSTNFPTTSGTLLPSPPHNPLQATSPFCATCPLVFVSKLNPTGSALAYSTYLGGNTFEEAGAITVDASGNVYVTGFTLSTNFPTTPSAFQTTFAGGDSGGGPGLSTGNHSDAFVTILNAAGSALLYSTYLGGSGTDSGNGIAVDSSGSVYVTGGTQSSNFPTTPGAFLSVFPGGASAFMAKIDPSKSGAASLAYSTYLGGSGDPANGIAVDASRNAYIVTNSTLVAKIDPSKSGAASLVYSTRLSSGTRGIAIAVDASGNAYITGQTNSTSFPTTPGAFQTVLRTGGVSNEVPAGDAFVTKLNPSGSAFVYSTLLGGSGGDEAKTIAVDLAGNAYVAGFTQSEDFPVVNPIVSSFRLQQCDDGYGGTFPCGTAAFVTELNATGSGLIYSTYLGLNTFDDFFGVGIGIAVDAGGSTFVAGTTFGGFPLTPGAFQLVPGGGSDIFVAKISPNDAPGFSLTSFSLTFPDEGVGGTTTPQTVTLSNTGSAALSIASITPSGDFAETNTCGSSLAGGTSCTISVTFTPTAAGARTGTITITDSAASSPQKVTLTGNGVAGLSATLSPTSLSFGNQTQGTTSAPQTLTFKNTGSATLTINGFSLGGTNPSDFSLSSTNCGQSLAVGASCTFGIAFAPQMVGNLSATLQVLDNSAQSPRSVPLAGVGIAPPMVTLSPTSLSFAAQVVGSTSSGQSVTLTTSGGGTLAISSINASSDFAASNNCGASMAGGASCTITVTFTPTAVGSRAGTLVIVDNATGSPQMVSLSGLGTDFSISPAVGSITSVTVTAGQPASYTVSAVGTSGFSGTVSLSCSDPAPQSSCSISPSSLMVNGTTAANATVAVTTTARSALPPQWRPPILPPGFRVAVPWLLVLLSLAMLTRALRRRSRRQRAWVGLATMLIVAALLFGCGGGGSTPPSQGTPAGMYQIPVSATSVGVTRTTTLSLTVR